MNHSHLFAFENDFVLTLRCIPMAVRLKLDVCGIKLSLRQWSRFMPSDRQILLTDPCETDCEITAYRLVLLAFVERCTGEVPQPLAEAPSFDWQLVERPSDVVVRYATALGRTPPSALQWKALTPLERFALIKLTRDSHDNVNFIPALKEFGLA